MALDSLLELLDTGFEVILIWWLACHHNPAVKPAGYDMIKMFVGKKVFDDPLSYNSKM